MNQEEKQRVVSELTEKLRAADTLIVTDYRGLTMPQIDALRGKLVEHGAQFTVVKNTLTRRAAEAAGADALLAMLEGPSAIAFIESDGDMVAVAKALADSARDTKILEIRGGLMQGRTISPGDVDELAKLPPVDVLRGQVLGAIVGPLQSLLGLVNAPLQNLVGLIDARIEQLEAGGGQADQPQGDQPEADQPESSADGAHAEVSDSVETVEVTDTAVEETVAADPEPDTTSDTEAEESTETTTSRTGEAGLAPEEA